ncbi:MAG: helix-turn-helix transcriptional regulator [Firmicutes bacterium]|nr:helix-turn-helix transcriptional regulator [Bacillota bacterium]
MARLKPSIYYYDVCRKNIRKFRTDKGLTQQQLADLSELSMHFISEIESTVKNKTFSIETVGRIADALQVPINELFKENKND